MIQNGYWSILCPSGDRVNKAGQGLSSLETFKAICYQHPRSWWPSLWITKQTFSFLWPPASLVWTTERSWKTWWNCNQLTDLQASLVKTWWEYETSTMLWITYNFSFLFYLPSDLSKAAVSGGVKLDLNSMPRYWTWVAWLKTRNPSYQTSKGYRLEAIFPWIFAPSAFITEAETANVDTKFIIRDLAQVGEHTEKWFS